MSWEQLPSSYDRVAAAYEDQFLGELAQKPRDRQLLDAFASSAGDPVLDIGSGPGHIGAYVRGRGRRAVGSDISRAMVERSASRLDGGVVADMRSLPLAENAVGGLVAFYSLIHIPRTEAGAVLREFARVLRPGGRMLLSVHEGDGRIELGEFLGEPVPFIATLFHLDELVTACQGAEMEVVLSERRPPYPTEHETFRLYVEAVATA